MSVYGCRTRGSQFTVLRKTNSIQCPSLHTKHQTILHVVASSDRIFAGWNLPRAEIIISLDTTTVTRCHLTMASKLARNAPIVAAAGGIYVAACYIGYSAVQTNKADVEATELALSSNNNDNFSFISNPNRTDQFQNVAAKYDDEIGRDESVMGINLLRRSLLYFHAKGTVLEVGAGTGRNIREWRILYCSGD
jgi:hypothetical protein